MTGIKRKYFSLGCFRTFCFSSIIQHITQCIHSRRTPPTLPLDATCILHRLYNSTKQINAGHSPLSMWSKTNHQLKPSCAATIWQYGESQIMLNVACSQLLCREVVGVAVSSRILVWLHDLSCCLCWDVDWCKQRNTLNVLLWNGFVLLRVCCGNDQRTWRKLRCNVWYQRAHELF